MTGSTLATTMRALRRSPAFALSTVLILGVGIGAAVGMYAVTDAVLRRPLPVLNQDRIVLPLDRDARGTDIPLTWDDLKALRAESRTLSGVAAVAHQGAFPSASLRNGSPIVLAAAWVTGNFFDVLGVRPALGRIFHAADESTREPSVMVISYDAWQRRFNGDSTVIGSTLTSPYTGNRYTIIGVAPAGLAYPAGVEYWTPLVYAGGLDVVGRLAPGATALAARGEFLTITRATRAGSAEHVLTIDGATMQLLPDAVSGAVRPALVVLAAAVTVLLLLVSINIGALLLLRSTARTHELAIRRSLGAGGLAVVMPCLAEAGVLTLTGGMLGFFLAELALRVIWRVQPVGLPRIDVITAGNAPLVATIAVALVVVTLLSISPALVALRSDPMTVLRGDNRAGRVGRGRLRRLFVAAQVALAVVLVSGSALLGRSLAKLDRIDLGFAPRHLSLIDIATTVNDSDVDARMADLLARAAPALRAVPGVQSVTPLAVEPFFGPGVFIGVWEAEGVSLGTDGQYPRIPFETGGADYFRTLGIPLLRGRGFLESDTRTSPRVAVVSAEAAKILGLGDDPVGRRIRLPGDTAKNAWIAVVGEAADIHYRTLRSATPTVFLPATQFFFQGLMAVRSSVPLAALLPQLARAVHDAQPGAVIARSTTMESMVSDQLAVPRLAALLMTGFGVVSLLLAAIGLFGLMAAVVREQTREIGIRLALGATPGQVRRGVLSGGLRIAVVGALLGAAVTLLAGRLLRSMLFQVSPTDPLAIAGAAVVLLLAGTLAAYWPARRATRVDPIRALASE